MSLEYIRLEGGLFSPDFLESIETRKGQKAEDFGLEGKVSLVEEISARWNYIQSLQTVFEHKKEKATKKGESLLGVTREHWVIPFLEELGYFEINYQKKQTIVGEKKFEISHRDGKEEGKGIPIIINSETDDIDKSSVAAQGRISSAHSVLQDYLNRTDEDLWGIVTNGRVIRILRNSAFLTRQAYLEFDLESILRNRKYDEFKILYRILHRSRFPKSGLPASACLLEEYRQDAIEEGGRIRDGLRIAVERSIEEIGNGFVQHKANGIFRDQIRNKEIIARDYYQQILYLIYRILFLFTAEERGLIVPKENNPAAKEYLLKTLRERSKRIDATEKRFVDVYYHLKTLFAIYRDSNLSELAGFPPLNGELFKEYSIIDAFELDNYTILRVFQSLSYFKPEGEKIQRRVNYAALDVEELGSVYESLLDFYPRLDEEKGIIRFSLGAGTERKATGSHYTHHDLVIETLKTSLIPVMEERLKAATSQEEKVHAILSMKVCDPACGSGHLLLSSARIMGKELARIREGQDEPNPIEVRKAVRDVISHCIYGVDKNPLAVDLCKVALWIEGYAEGKPLTFLDHRIRCGDSLVGVFSVEQLEAGIPDGAYNAVSGDDKKIAQFYKKDNQGKKLGEQELFIDEPGNKILVHSLEAIQKIESLEDDSPENVRAKKQMYEEMHKEIHFKREKLACDLWTFAFFQNLILDTQNKKLIPTTEDIRTAISGGNVNPNLVEQAELAAKENRFFHWFLEFPEVFALNPLTPFSQGEKGGHGGFDVVAGNPPWERIKLQEKEFFATRDTKIATAQNKAAREELIKKLPKNNPTLLLEFENAKHAAEANSKFIRESNRYPLTAVGDINTYAVFSELCRVLVGNGRDRSLQQRSSRVGIIVPTGIATDDTCKRFFGDLVEKKNLVSIIGFENEAFIFKSVHHSFKFCIFTITNEAIKTKMDFTFFARYFSDLKNPFRHFILSAEEIALINPNTLTCPIFRTKPDAEITKLIFNKTPILMNEKNDTNPWKMNFLRMLDMANDSNLFLNQPTKDSLPLYEAKMFYLYDHRYTTYEGATEANLNAGILPHLPLEEKENPKSLVKPRYWVKKKDIEDKLIRYDKEGNVEWEWKRKWFIAFRDVTNSISERTSVFSMLPRIGVGHKAPLMLSMTNSIFNTLLFANLSSFIFDFFTRQKVGGLSFSFFILKQLPVLPPERYTREDIEYIVPRVVELVYTAWDIKAFADDVWCEAEIEQTLYIKKQERENAGSKNPQPLTSETSLLQFKDTADKEKKQEKNVRSLRGLIINQWDDNKRQTGGHENKPPEWAKDYESDCADKIPLAPFKWNEERRAVLKAELDAYYAKLYGLTRKQLRYILDPHGLSDKELENILDPTEDDSCWGADLLPRDPSKTFPGETFRVLKEKESKLYGYYRTRRLVLDAWERLGTTNTVFKSVEQVIEIKTGRNFPIIKK